MLQSVLMVSKGGSIGLIVVALGVELWDQWAGATDGQLPGFLPSALIYLQVILVAHGIEAIIAASFARSRQREPFSYGVYTFFVGFPGLWELLQTSQSDRE